MYLVQAWALPAVRLPEPLSLKVTPPVTLRNVQVSPPGMPTFPTTLIECDGTNETIFDDPEKDMRHLAKILARLSFTFLRPFHVFAARLVQSDVKLGDKVIQLAFPGPPPGIALFERTLGFNTTVKLELPLLEGDLPLVVDGAITWFLQGLSAPNAIHQVVCYWAGLEMLAPPVRGPWRCAECDTDVPYCPSCNQPTEGPKTVRTIREFLEKTLSVSRREYKELYELRCQIAHGSMAMDAYGLDAASGKATRIQGLLLSAIKHVLKWPMDKPPLIQPDGFKIVGVSGVETSAVVGGASFYDHPTVYPS